MDRHVEAAAWDNRPRDAMPLADIHHIIANNETCVLTRLRKDGHPIGAVVGGGLLDGEIYTCTNLFRAALRAVQRDERVCAVFDIPHIGSVSVIGRAEVIDDHDTMARFFAMRSHRAWVVRHGKVTPEEYIAMAFTPNRRLLRIVPDKYVTSDQRTLVRS